MDSKPAAPEPSFDPLNLDVAYEGTVDPLNLEADYEGIELRILASLGLTREQVEASTRGMTYGDILGLTDRYRAEVSALRAPNVIKGS